MMNCHLMDPILESISSTYMVIEEILPFGHRQMVNGFSSMSHGIETDI